MSPYRLEYDSRTESELRRLPLRLRRQIDWQLEFLCAAPFRSHPGVRVKAIREVPGIWHFHATKDIHVFYTTQGPVLWVVMVDRSRGVKPSSLRELRKRL